MHSPRRRETDRLPVDHEGCDLKGDHRVAEKVTVKIGNLVPRFFRGEPDHLEGSLVGEGNVSVGADEIGVVDFGVVEDLDLEGVPGLDFVDGGSPICADQEAGLESVAGIEQVAGDVADLLGQRPEGGWRRGDVGLTGGRIAGGQDEREEEERLQIRR